ncbi:MAG: pilus assembly protein N-terminal domain-containing protein, partial [Vampirovibrionales bacterium]|nr:pilus assembly protein N-terminal domain-containing protein [Vampirovibrionales bacterium]
MSPVLIMSPVIKAIAHTLILGGIMVNPTLTPVTSAALAQTVPVAAPQDTGLMMLALSEPEPALKPLSSQPWAKAVLGASTITTKASGATLSSAKDATETKTVAHNPDKDVQSLKVTQDKKDTPARKAAPVLAAAALPKATFASIPQAETVQAALEGSTAKPLDSSVLANASAKPAINAKADLVSTLMQASPLTEERLVPAPDQIASAQVLPKQMPVAITQPGKAVMAVAPMAVTHPEAIAPNASAKLSSGNSSKLTQPVALTEAPPLLASAVTPTVAPALATSPVKNVSTGVSATLANLSANQVDLTLGKAVVIDLKKPASRISISDPETAQAVVISPSVVQLIGNQVGSTSLLVWFGNSSKAHQIYDVTVMRDMTLLQRQLKSIAPRVRVLPLAGEDTVVLAGEADTQIEAETAVSLAQVFLASRGGGSAAAGASNAGSSSGAAKKTGPSSQAVGSSLVSEVPKVMNMIQIKGVPSTKIELVKQQLLTLDSGIQLSVYKNEDGREKAVLTGKVPTPGIVSKAINLTSVFYGQPGLKVLTGPGGNSVRQTGDT